MELDLLKKVIAEVLGVDPSEITLQSRFYEDLGADSLDKFQILMNIEQELNMEFPQSDLTENIDTVEDALKLLQSAMK